jgi:hypothetical protein
LGEDFGLFVFGLFGDLAEFLDRVGDRSLFVGRGIGFRRCNDFFGEPKAFGHDEAIAFARKPHLELIGRKSFSSSNTIEAFVISSCDKA